MLDQFMKGMQSFKTPQFDATKFISMQQKNAETFTTLAQSYGETAQEFAKKTAEFVQQNVESAINASRDVLTSTAPDQNAAKQGDYAKKTLATATKQARELTDMATKTQYKAFDMLSKRFGETIDEAKELAKTAA